MTSLWSRLHWIQKALFVIGILSFVTILAGIGVIQGLSLGWGLIGIGLVGITVTIVGGAILEGLEEPKQ